MMSAGVMSSEQIQIRRDLVIGISASLVIHIVFAAGWLSVMAAAALQVATLDRLRELPLEEMRQAFQQPDREDPPLMFVEVTPEQAATEAPKDTQYYSSLSSKAANPDTDQDTS